MFGALKRGSKKVAQHQAFGFRLKALRGDFAPWQSHNNKNRKLFNFLKMTLQYLFLNLYLFYRHFFMFVL